MRKIAWTDKEITPAELDKRARRGEDGEIDGDRAESRVF